jgi:hypothetical protein
MRSEERQKAAFLALGYPWVLECEKIPTRKPIMLKGTK